MSLKAVRFAAHCGSVFNYVYAINYEWNIKMPTEVDQHRQSFGGAWKFMTFWNLWVQCGMSLICLMDILAQDYLSKSLASTVRGIRDYFFTSLGFPIGIFVAFMFWGLWWVDRDLVMPKAMDAFIPVYVNHMLHSTCFFIELFELFSSQHSYVSRMRGLLSTSLFTAAYLTWVCYIAHAGGFWVYPIMGILPPFQRVLYFAFSILVIDLIYFLGNILNNFVWEGTVPTHVRRFHKEKAQKYE